MPAPLVNHEHGGSDAGPAPLHDFSTNASPLPAPAALLDALLCADRSRYPDPAYTALREQLGAAEGVSAARVLPASGGAEAIRRLSLAALLSGVRQVWVPQPGFGDYAAAAGALGLQLHPYARLEQVVDGLRRWQAPALVWVCDPCNPTGESPIRADWLALAAALAETGSPLVIDQAYEPLRLTGASELPAELAARCWRLICPNKALALTGVRAAYLLAPETDEVGLLAHARRLAPSWVLSAEGCALLMHWHSENTRAHLRQLRPRLSAWRDTQRHMLSQLNWQQRDSSTPFWLARPPQDSEGLLSALRTRGIKLRDARSFGLAGWLRLSTQTPASQQALLSALQELAPR